MNKEERVFKDPNRLVVLYKKHGGFDETRKLLFEEFKRSQLFLVLQEDLKEFIKITVSQDPNILSKNRGQMAALLKSQFFKKNSMNQIEEFVRAKFEDQSMDNEFLRQITRDLNREFVDTYTSDI